MANKKINELQARVPQTTDLILIGDPTTGYSFKATLSQIQGNGVPYTGANANVNLGEYGLSGGYLALDTTPTNVPAGVGVMSWDAFYGTPQITLAGGNVSLQLGQEQLVLVRNNSGAAMSIGQVVYITGSTGELPTVGLASNNSEAASSVTLGVVVEAIGSNANGYVSTSGIVHGINTNAFNEGEAVWLGVNGALTNVKPSAPANAVLVGYVVKKSGGNGSIFVKIQNGYELDELHNVSAANPTDNSILQYKSSTGLWTSVAGSTTNIAEGTNLYFTNDRARAALSFAEGSGAYNPATGVISIPTNTNQLTNGAGFITSAALSGYVQGSGTINFVPKWTAAGTLGNSQIFDNGTFVGINTTTNAGFRLDVNGTARVQGALTVSGSTTAASAIARGIHFTPTLVASANNDVLVGLDINPTFSTGSFTGVQTAGLRVQEVIVGRGNGALSNNTVVGRNALINTTGGGNTAMGNGSLQSNTIGTSNTAIGNVAMNSNTTGSENVACGSFALNANISGNSNSALGNQALQNLQSGNGNVAIGYWAGRYFTGTANLTNATNSIFIGFDTRPNANNENNQIVIGNQAVGLGSNTTVLGNSSTTFTRIFGNVGLGTSTNSGFLLDVNGTARVQGSTQLTTLAGTGNRMVVANASGVLSTQAIPTIPTNVSAFNNDAGYVTYVPTGLSEFVNDAGYVKSSEIPSSIVSGYGQVSFLPRWVQDPNAPGNLITTRLGQSRIFDNGMGAIGIATTSFFDTNVIMEIGGNVRIQGAICTGAGTGSRPKWILGSFTSQSAPLLANGFINISIDGTPYKLAIIQ